ncbi:MAG: DUF4197 domain-containing protein [Acidobacteriota bacterium]
MNLFKNRPEKYAGTKHVVLIFLLILFVSCAGFEEILERSLGTTPLTDKEVSFGLKEALEVGTGIAVSGLSLKDGFLKDDLIKILLPEKTAKVVNIITKIPGGRTLINNVILRLNRAAEDAVKSAGPIFMSAIKSLTIKDAFDILRGSDDEATRYLRGKTFIKLEKVFKPEINKSLDKVLVGNISTNQSWDMLTGKYNKVANSVAGKIAGLKNYNVNLGNYVTHKALDAIFLKLSGEERKIREDPLARTTQILRRVFGSIKK